RARPEKTQPLSAHHGHRPRQWPPRLPADSGATQTRRLRNLARHQPRAGRRPGDPDPQPARDAGGVETDGVGHRHCRLTAKNAESTKKERPDRRIAAMRHTLQTATGVSATGAAGAGALYSLREVRRPRQSGRWLQTQTDPSLTFTSSIGAS